MKSRDLKLDDRDLRIIATLQREGRISNSELAERINLSSTPCWERLGRLEKAGIIEGYGVRVALAHFAPIAQVIVSVELDSHRAEDFERFETAVSGIPEIFECLAAGGGIDYVLKILVRDLEAYQALVDAILQAGIGVRRYYTYVMTEAVKQAPPPVTMFHAPRADAGAEEMPPPHGPWQNGFPFRALTTEHPSPRHRLECAANPQLPTDLRRCR